ncbi:MAG: tRNA 2-thiouridine(34) synthase MnmA [Candidatus Krumholzibacteriota bacterium]|nr:tRNA 2-thiouridine(34) synthase MnmA [Candidatus Krumholzibacteriota bacterium]
MTKSPDDLREAIAAAGGVPEGRGAGVAVGMSGGVDSAAAAWILAGRGYRVVGVTFRFVPRSAPCASNRGQSDDADVLGAAALCRRLGVEHVVEDLAEDFDREVIGRFVDAYRRGETPNPCILCNEKVKFPALARAADRRGLPLVATGHYARTVRFSRGAVFLAAGLDEEKDQSYFLYRVPVSILERTIFPLGGLCKEEVVRAAARAGVAPQRAGESQDACFVPAGGLRDFLAGRIDVEPGEVVDEEGRVLGRHDGTALFTVGQRRGLGIAGPGARYVKEIDPAKRRIVLAPAKALGARRVLCRSPRLRTRRLLPPLEAKIRSRHRPADVAAVTIVRGGFVVELAEFQRAPTPGQSLVLYRDGVVLGGGVIAPGSTP